MSKSVIILAHLMESNGTLDKETIARINKGIEVYDRGSYADILLCGWAYRKDAEITLAEAMQCHINASFPEHAEACILQPLSRDTVGDAFFSKLLLDLKYPKMQHEVTIVTSDYHAHRASTIFEFIFGENNSLRVDSIPYESTPEIAAHERLSLQTFRQTFKAVQPGNTAKIYDRLSSSHSFYNGIAGPKIDQLHHLRTILSLCSLA